MERLPLLVLVRNITRTLSYYDDWQDALRGHPAFDSDIEDIEPLDHHPRIRTKIEKAPFVVALHSTNGNGTKALDALTGALQSRRGKLAVFVGNEVNLAFPTMRSKLDTLKAIRPEFIATQLLEETGRWYYEEIEGAAVRNITHGINARAFRPGPPLKERPIDIGARSDRYNIYVGDDQRVALHDLVKARAKERGFRTDIVLGGERFDRNGWAAFLGKAKTTIATEAGSDFLDRDDRLSAEVTALLRRERGGLVIKHESWPRKLSRKLLPRSARHWVARRLANSMVEDVHLHRTADDAVIDEVRRKVFRPECKSPYPTKVISSRHFDAAACKTLQILTSGRYNDMLTPGRHFIEIDQDFSNIDDVLDRLTDLSFCQKMVDDAFDDLMASHTYAHRMADLESALRSL
ncbi:MAG: glycosyltransferase [Pseudomonadota bacterium]